MALLRHHPGEAWPGWRRTQRVREILSRVPGPLQGLRSEGWQRFPTQFCFGRWGPSLPGASKWGWALSEQMWPVHAPGTPAQAVPPGGRVCRGTPRVAGWRALEEEKEGGKVGGTSVSCAGRPECLGPMSSSRVTLSICRSPGWPGKPCCPGRFWGCDLEAGGYRLGPRSLSTAERSPSRLVCSLASSHIGHIFMGPPSLADYGAEHEEHQGQ